MPTVSYKRQPGIAATGGHISDAIRAGRSHLYTVSCVLWPDSVEDFLSKQLVGQTIHVCCGKSHLGHIRLDLNEPSADIQCDAADMKQFVGDKTFDTVLCDPPYNGKFDWTHRLLAELARIARQRIIFQHWFIPSTPHGRYKKAHDEFGLSAVYVWQPRTYFGRAQIISVFDYDPCPSLVQERLLPIA